MPRAALDQETTKLAARLDRALITDCTGTRVDAIDVRSEQLQSQLGWRVDQEPPISLLDNGAVPRAAVARIGP